MLRFVRCIRPLNLALIYLTQILFYNLFFPSAFCGNGYNEAGYDKLVLSDPYIYLFAFITVIIAASGYLINDYFDFDSDLKNAKTNRLNNKSAYLAYYWIVVFLGFILSLWLALVVINKVLLAGIYVMSVAALFLYSAKWKKKVLIGNIVVSLFSAFVILILIYAEKDYLTHTPKEHEVDLLSMFIYSGFAFFVSMVREIIKDIEDVSGDKAVGYRTLPIVSGIERAKSIASYFAWGLLVLIIGWMTNLYWSGTLLIILLLSGLLLVAPVLYVLVGMLSKTKMNPSLLSSICKIHMVFGIFVLIINQIEF